MYAYTTFKGYAHLAKDNAMIIGCNKHATRLLQHRKFMDSIQYNSECQTPTTLYIHAPSYIALTALLLQKSLYKTNLIAELANAR